MNCPNLINPIRDTFGRPLHDLRISVIDRCNLRCNYCMPAEDSHKSYNFLKKPEWLTFAEITRLAKIFISLGVVKLRLTGGEPLLRPGLPDLVRQLSALSGVEDLALTTNGILLSELASELQRAGLKRLTVSLDSLDDEIFRRMNGNKGHASEVLAGIEAAQKAGFTPIKINCVVQKGVNDHTIIHLVRYCKKAGHILRLIEYMDVGNQNGWRLENVVPSRELAEVIGRKISLVRLNAHYRGEVALRYGFADGSGEIGFISSVTQPFCSTCNRARISTDGKLYTCLFGWKGTDLRKLLREGASDIELRDIIAQTWQKREDRYSELRSKLIQNPHPPKIEMFQIGG